MTLTASLQLGDAISSKERRLGELHANCSQLFLTLMDKIMFADRGEPSGIDETSSKKQYVRVPRLRMLHSSRFTTLSLTSYLPFEALRALSISGVSTLATQQASRECTGNIMLRTRFACVRTSKLPPKGHLLFAGTISWFWFLVF